MPRKPHSSRQELEALATAYRIAERNHSPRAAILFAAWLNCLSDCWEDDFTGRAA